MYRLRIISVGKIKKPFWLEAIGHYRKMLGTALCVEALSVRDCPHLEGAGRKKAESDRLLEKITPRRIRAVLAALKRILEPVDNVLAHYITTRFVGFMRVVQN